MTIGERITALIEDNDRTIADLSAYIECNPRQITRWKNDEAEIGSQKLMKICLFYGVSADYLLGLPKGLKWER